MKPSGRADAALLGVAFIWGSTFVVVKEALSELDPLPFLALRFVLAGSVLVVTYRRQLSGIFARKGTMRGGVLAGTVLFGAYVFQTIGLQWTTASKSAFLTGLSIVLVPLLASIVYRVVPQFPEVLGAVVAAIGMSLMTLEGTEWRVGVGDLLTLVGAVFYAFHMVIIGHYAPREGFERLSVLQVCTAGLLALLFCGLLQETTIRWSGMVIGALAITGILATATAFTVQAWAQQHTTATRAAVIFAVEPIFAAVTSFVVMREVLDWRAALGAVLILSGILIVELKPLKIAKHQ